MHFVPTHDNFELCTYAMYFVTTCDAGDAKVTAHSSVAVPIAVTTSGLSTGWLMMTIAWNSNCTAINYTGGVSITSVNAVSSHSTRYLYVCLAVMKCSPVLTTETACTVF